MRTDAITSRRARVVLLLIPLFAASGATSLIYETVWARQLHLVFGTSQLAICTLLAAFMAGLAIGGFAGGRFADRVRRPLLGYALLEGVIAVYALAFPLLLRAVEPVYLGFHAAVDPDPLVFGVFQFALLGLLLLPPTACMGATLPLLARLVTTRDGADTGRQVGRLYGVNTLGAVIGIAAAGFLLLPRLGLSATTTIAAAANGALAIGAVLLSLASERPQIAPAPSAAPISRSADQTPRVALSSLMIIAGIAGFAALVYEVAWFRLMTLLLGGSAYAFSIMLLAFLLGIGLGGWAGGAFADRVWRRGGAPLVLRRLAQIQAAVAVAAWISMFAYAELPLAFVKLNALAQSAPALLWPAKLLLALLIMLVPALLMGAAFPLLVRCAAPPASGVAQPVGRIYGANSVGAVLGAFAGGFVFLPGLHVQGTVMAAALCNLVAAFLAVAAIAPLRPEPRRLRLAGCAIAAGAAALLGRTLAPAWHPLLMTSGMYHYARVLESPTREALLDSSVRPYELIYYEEGLSSVVVVARDTRDGSTFLSNNGKIDASSRGDLATQLLLGHLPLAFDPTPERVLVIGLASGITAGVVTLQDGPAAIDIVEIEPAIITACRRFDRVNHKPLDDPRVVLHLNDARNHLLLSEDGAYDMVTSEPSNPWLSGVANLFTREFFALGKRKLAPGGVWAQWVQTYGMSPHDLRSLLGTFADTYEHVRLFRPLDGDLVLVGSDEPLDFSPANVRHVVSRDPFLLTDLIKVDIRGPQDLFARYLMDRDAILELAAGVERNTDDNMRIEYSAPLHLHDHTIITNKKLLAQWASVPFDATDGSAEGLVTLGKALARRGDDERAQAAFNAAIALDASVAAEIEAVIADASEGEGDPHPR